jgi:TonB family protein
LTQTWPTGDDQLPPLLDYDLPHGHTYLYSKVKPLYAFGYGLSYTNFAYEGLKLSSTKVDADGTVQATVRVRNTGKRDGDEVVQLYVQHLGSAVTRPQLELKGFKRVHIAAGATQDVTLELKPRDLAYWDAAAHVWRVEKEQVRVLAGGSSDHLPVQATVDVDSTSEATPIQRRVSATAKTGSDLLESQLVRVGGPVSAPVVQNHVVTEYSDEARAAGYEGVCLVQVIVDTQGNPQNARIVRSIGMGLDEKAIAAVRTYKFKPAMRSGTAVPVRITVEVNFRMRD